jgi:plastocyanin
MPAMAATTHTVTQNGLNFEPSDIVVLPGDTVEWVWTSGTHTVTSGTPCTPDGRFNSPLDAGNPSFSYIIPSGEPAGAIPYFCVPHCGAGMIGTITVIRTPIPTVSEWGVVVMILATLVAGTVIFRLRHRAAAA